MVKSLNNPLKIPNFTVREIREKIPKTNQCKSFVKNPHRDLTNQFNTPTQSNL